MSHAEFIRRASAILLALLLSSCGAKTNILPGSDDPDDAGRDAPGGSDADGDSTLMCRSNDECDDGIFCNGAEVCDPDIGCLEGSGDPCQVDQVCDEDEDRCQTTCAVGDTDGDGFDSIDCGGDDCDDNNESIHPEAEEICNGVDDDCDGQFDPPLEKIGEDLIINDGPSWSSCPSLLWTGREYGLAWLDRSVGDWQVRLNRISLDGRIVADDLTVTDDAAEPDCPSLAWSGSEYGVVWSDGRDGYDEIYFNRISEDGRVLGADVRVTDAHGASFAPSIVWTGAEYGVAWADNRDGRFEIYFNRLSVEGDIQGPDLVVTSNQMNTASPWLSWADSEFGVTWTAQADVLVGVFFRRVSAAGDVLGDRVGVCESEIRSQSPSMQWNGSSYGVVWSNGYNEITFNRLTSGGSPLSDPISLTDSVSSTEHPVLAWTGDGYGMAWSDGRDGQDEIYFRLISADGLISSEDHRITNAPDSSVEHSLAWTGEEFGVAWSDFRDTRWEVYFARIGGCIQP